ncbi:MAG: S-layer homology domain-containing protein [Oscillibacter sp.]|nr:S-layer homology domain-containing protein [Oscillibacter sp.]
MKRVWTALAALCLLVLGLPVSAAQSPGVTYWTDGDNVRLALEGVEEKISGLQLELTLEGRCPDAVFTPAPADAYSPPCRVELDGNTTRITLYLAAEEGLLEGKNLFLGTLSPRGSCSLPSRGELLLLDRSLEPVAGSAQRVQMTQGSGPAPQPSGERWQIRMARMEHGTVTARPSPAAAGETVTLTASPDTGYQLERITVRDTRGQELRTSKSSETRVTFVMPNRDVEVSAEFTAGKETKPEPAFQDVRPGDWCYDAVRYVYQEGLMNGTTSTTFNPNGTTTRGMIVAILYRLEGSPSTGISGFTDVASGVYYASAVAWASANGIVNGYSDNTFRPGNPITREQMAAFLYRYASYKGRDVSRRGDLSAFEDAGQIAPYAVDAMSWANGMGLINGTSAVRLTPSGNATRAQAAVILSRYAQNVVH